MQERHVKIKYGQHPVKPGNWLRLLITIACIAGGTLAGGNIYRYVIEVPAWRHLSITSWAAYSEHADLKNGIFLFPAQAIGTALPLLLASIIIVVRKPAFRSVALPVHCATFFSLMGLVLTLFAAPVMLNLTNLADDPETLQQAFDNFHF
jgi:hypothetical protein